MKRLYIYLFALTIISCVDPIHVDNENNANLLVVEGKVTSELGPHVIRLTRSAKYGSVFDGVINGETGASLFIRDDLGNTVKLKEDGSGYYSTSDEFRGIVGRAYSLFIKTKDQQEYQSYPEALVEVSAIEKLSYVFTELPSETDVPISGIDLVVDYKDEANADNFYKWEVGGTYWFKSNPELYMPPRSPVAVPKECCAECYTSEELSILSISKDNFYDGNTTTQKINFIEDDGSRFSNKYVAYVKQFSISQEAYNFFELIENQLSVQGSIFDPPPAQIRGNIVNLTNPDEDVVGFFYASDVSSDTLHIDGSTLPYRKKQLIIPDDCREVPGATTVIPAFW